MVTQTDIQNYLAGKDSNGKQIRPPVVPEITAAYKNDPRTQLAIQAMANGSSTAPVAGGKYGVADGIARVLNAGMGGAMNRQQEQKYGTDQTQLLAQRAARGQDGLNGMSIPPQGAPPPVPPGAPPPGPPPAMAAPPPVAPPPPSAMTSGQDATASPMAQQVAAALQGGQSPQGAPAPAAGGPSPMPPQGPPPVAPTGGQPGGGNPFPVGSNTSSQGVGPPNSDSALNPQSYVFQPKPGESIAQLTARASQAFPGHAITNGGDHITVQPTKGSAAPSAAPNAFSRPVDAPIPDMPAAMDRPVAPQAVAAVKSPLLAAAYKLMIDANPYESANGQAMYAKGLADQSDMNEAAAQRQQGVNNAGYQTDLGVYANDENARRAAAINARNAVIAHNQSQQDEFTKYQQTSHENTLNRQKDLQVANINHAHDGDNGGPGGSTTLTPEEQAALNKAVGDGRIDLKGITKFQAKVVGSALVANPTLNAIELHGKANMVGNVNARKNAQLISIMPDVLNNVKQAGSALNYSDAKVIGGAQAFFKGQLNDPKLASYMTQRNDAMQTLAQVMSGVGASDMRTKMEAEAAPKTMSPKAWEGWYNGQLTTLMPRIRNAEKQGLVPSGTADDIAQRSGIGGAPAPAKTGNPLVDKYL